MLKLEKRPQPSHVWTWVAPLLAVVLTMLLGGALFAALGKDPVEAIATIFWQPLFGEHAFYYRPQLLVKGAPLVLIAIGLALGFKAGIWNIGAEGQYIIGALTGAAVGLAFYPLEAWYIFPLMVLAGALGGWLWPMKNPDGYGFPGSRNFQEYPAAHNAELFAGSGMHWGVVAALIAVILAYILLGRHILGYQIRLTGQAPRAARFAGVSPARLVLFCLGASGALAGLAGMFEVSGPAGQVSIDFNVGYGFTAIIVAFLGRLHPVGIALAGLLMALTYIGGEIAQSSLGLPAAAIQLFQGTLLFVLLAVDLLTNYRVRLKTAEAA